MAYSNFGFPSNFFGGRYFDMPIGGVTVGVENPIVFPIDVLKNKLDRFLEIWTSCLIGSFLGGQL